MDQLEFLDRIKTLTIVAIASDDRLMEELVLKGGNAIDLIYGVSTRASADLDFSMGAEFEPLDAMKRRITDVLVRTFLEHKFQVFDVNIREVPASLSEDLKIFWGGYCVDFKLATLETYSANSKNIEMLRRLAETIGGNGSTRFKIDISKHEYCDGKLDKEISGFQIFVYSPVMIVSEKLRAICQQMPEYAKVVKRTRDSTPRARDFVDIFNICEKLNVRFESEELRTCIQRVFEVKRVPLSLLGRIIHYKDFHELDFVSVKATSKPGATPEDFDFYFNYIIENCRSLESLWKVDSPS